MAGATDQAAALTANRRKEIFKTVRGSKLSGLRGRAAGESRTPDAGATKKLAVVEDAPQAGRRVRLGSLIEDEIAGIEARTLPRYSEPND